MEFIQPLHLKNAFYGKHNANKFQNHTIIYFVLISQTDIGMHYKSLLRNNHVHFRLRRKALNISQDSNLRNSEQTPPFFTK
jgi:hypothetical protein